MTIDPGQFVWITVAATGAPAMVVIAALGAWYADKYRKLQAEIQTLREELHQKSGEIAALRKALVEITARPIEVTLATQSDS